MFINKQIPQETVFMSKSDTSYQDKLVKNRIHFQFPKNWSTNQNKTNIIGIRSIYITRGYRNAEIGLKVSLKIKDLLGDIQYEEPYTITVDKFFDDYTLLKEFITKINDHIQDITWKKTPPNYNQALRCYYDFIPDENNTDFHKSRFVIKSPYNDLPEEDRTVDAIGNGGVTTSYIYYFEFEIVSMNDDCTNLLNYSKDTRKDKSQPIYTYDVWDRNSCILFSNLSYMSEKSFLGHTRKYELNGIKYYELTNNNQSFWVDMYAAVDHKAPVYLPKDEKEELYIEAQLLTSNKAVL